MKKTIVPSAVCKSPGKIGGRITKLKKAFLCLFIIILFTPGCGTTHKAMDIVSPGSVVDDNFLLKNPVWGIIADKPGSPIPHPDAFCPCGSEKPDEWTAASNCTTQQLQYNEPSGVNYYICGSGGGHMNYFPITYECNVCWNDHSGEDDDYNFRLHRNDNALYTAGWDGFLQAEFDSEETVDNWDDTNTWWNDFHHNKVDDSHEAATGAIDGKFAIVIGEAGIDYEHGCHIELHPVYAMFVHVNDDPNNDQWAFFVRNWGNEGYCGNNQVYYQSNLLESNTMRIKIPHELATDFILSNQNIKGINDNNQTLSIDAVNVPDGMLLTFHLDAPEVHSVIVGDLTIQWLHPGTRLQQRKDVDNTICSGLGVSSQPLDSSDDDGGINRRMEKLDTLSRTELFKRVNEQFRIKPMLKMNSVVIKRVNARKEEPPTRELKKINYSKMIYYGQDTAASKRKNERLAFIKDFLKAKGIN